MSSTVTTTTVSTITAAITLEGLGQVLSLAAMVMLMIVLLAKEISVVSQTRVGRALSRGLDIGATPLLLVFGLMVGLNLVSTFGG